MHDITWLYHTIWLLILLAFLLPLAKVLFEIMSKDKKNFDNMVQDIGPQRALGIERCTRGLCMHCGGQMRPSMAYQNSMTFAQDFPGEKTGSRGQTMSRDGVAQLVNCVKCEACGWSVTTDPEDDHA